MASLHPQDWSQSLECAVFLAHFSPYKEVGLLPTSSTLVSEMYQLVFHPHLLIHFPLVSFHPVFVGLTIWADK